MKLTQKDILQAVIDQTGLTKKDASAAVNTIFSYIKEQVVDGNKVSVAQFGIFAPKTCQERQSRNMHTKETMVVPAHTVVRFSVASSFKEAVYNTEVKD